MKVKCPFQKYESEYSAHSRSVHEKGQFMDCYEEGCMAYRAEAKDSDGGVRVKAGCRLIDEYVEHSTPFNNYNTL